VTLVDQRPDSAPPRAWRFPAFERRTVDSGLHLILCHLPGRPLAAARLVLDAGGTTEPSDQAGVGLLATRALPEGTEDLDAHQLAEKMEGMGAEIRGEVSHDSMQIRLDVPASRLGAGLELLADVARRPAFRDVDVDRLRKERLDQLAQERSVPEALASKAFERSVFVPGAAYARSLGGDETSVGNLDRDKVEAFYRGRLDAAAATLVVVGDLAGVDVAAIAERSFGAWPVGPFEAPSPNVDTVDAGRRIVLVDRPGSVQSALAIGHAGPSRRTPDYVPTGTMAMCLGGVFGSRLNMKLREEKGYTYGAFAGFDFRRHGGTFGARSAVQTDVTADAVVDAVGEIARTAEGGIPEDELAPVREYRVGVFPIAYERPAAVAIGLADMVVHDLPDGWFDTVRDEMAATTSEHVSTAAARHLLPDSLAVIVVGDASRIADALAATDLGPVQPLTL
jgi:predicted Zn-dependent peptidase